MITYFKSLLFAAAEALSFGKSPVRSAESLKNRRLRGKRRYRRPAMPE